MFALAIRQGAIPINPVRDTSRLRKPRRAVIALTDENLQVARTAIRDWQRPVPGKPGPRHSGDLADVVDLMLATGARIGEILALRWEDLDGTEARLAVLVSGLVKPSPASVLPGPILMDMARPSRAAEDQRVLVRHQVHGDAVVAAAADRH